MGSKWDPNQTSSSDQNLDTIWSSCYYCWVSCGMTESFCDPVECNAVEGLTSADQNRWPQIWIVLHARRNHVRNPWTSQRWPMMVYPSSLGCLMLFIHQSHLQTSSLTKRCCLVSHLQTSSQRVPGNLSAVCISASVQTPIAGPLPATSQRSHSSTKTMGNHGNVFRDALHVTRSQSMFQGGTNFMLLVKHDATLTLTSLNMIK